MRFRMFSDAFGLSLFLPAAFAHEVGAAEGRKQGDAAAQRGGLVGVYAMLGQQRHGRAAGVVAFCLGAEVDVSRSLAVLGVVATVEQAAIGKGGHGEAEEEDYGYC